MMQLLLLAAVASLLLDPEIGWEPLAVLLFPPFVAVGAWRLARPQRHGPRDRIDTDGNCRSNARLCVRPTVDRDRHHRGAATPAPALPPASAHRPRIRCCCRPRRSRWSEAPRRSGSIGSCSTGPPIWLAWLALPPGGRRRCHAALLRAPGRARQAGDPGGRAGRDYPRRIGRVRQVGPPLPLTPISWAAYGGPRSRPPPAGAPMVGCPPQDDHARPDRQHVAAQRRELVGGDMEQPDAQLPEQLVQAGRQQRQVDHREVVRDRRDHDSRWRHSSGPRASTATSKISTRRPRAPPAARAPARFVRSDRPMHSRSGRSQNVSPPSTVPGASIRPMVGMPCASVQRLQSRPPRPGGSACPNAAGWRPGRSPAAGRTCRPGRAVGLRAQLVDRRRPGAPAGRDEGVVLARRRAQVDGMAEAVRRVVECAPERRTRGA